MPTKWYEIKMENGAYSLSPNEQEHLLERIRQAAVPGNGGNMTFAVQPIRPVDDTSLPGSIGDWLSCIYDNQLSDNLQGVLEAAFGEEAARYTLVGYGSSFREIRVSLWLVEDFKKRYGR